MKIIAPAKLNLFLHITGRRTDHFHLLESLFVFTEFGDEITISADQALSLSITDFTQHQLKNEPVEKNLIYRAAVALKEKHAISQGAHIHLFKKIPIAAGLGGGSSDAAATLHALNAFWQLGLSNEALAQIGLTLGADVPACIYQQAAFVSGIGEIVQPIQLPFSSLPILLVNPNQPLSTQMVFQTYQKNNPGFHVSVHDDFIKHTKSAELFQKFLMESENDLQLSAVQLMPCIQEILSLLQSLPDCQLTRMSGSGPTCFAIFSNQHAAKKAKHIVMQRHPNYWVELTTLHLLNCST